jgi:alkenylglycerophosphocholine/alkenylglycerophosphoethanolamine hydrolase
VELPLALVIFGALVLVSALSADGRWPSVFAFAKPATTLSLLLVTGLPSDDRFGVLVVGALLLSALGDTALLHEGQGFFLAGIFLFLLAHVAYGSAFLMGAGGLPIGSSVLIGGAVIAFASLYLVRRIWGGVSPGLRVPVLVYALAITLMVGASYVVLGGPWPTRIGIAVCGGAIAFYLSDALLAWGKFYQPVTNLQAIGLLFYWAGQLGIALGARWVGVGEG